MGDHIEVFDSRANHAACLKREKELREHRRQNHPAIKAKFESDSAAVEKIRAECIELNEKSAQAHVRLHDAMQAAGASRHELIQANNVLRGDGQDVGQDPPTIH